MTTQTELKPCPCGKTPASINVVGEHGKPKYAYCYGDCCNVWEVEFRNDYAEFHSDESNSKAVDAWNAAPRAFLAKIDAAEGEVPEVVAYRIVNHDSGTTITTDGLLYEAAKVAGMRVDWLAVVGGIPGMLAASGRQDGAR